MLTIQLLIFFGTKGHENPSIFIVIMLAIPSTQKIGCQRAPILKSTLNCARFGFFPISFTILRGEDWVKVFLDVSEKFTFIILALRYPNKSAQTAVNNFA